MPQTDHTTQLNMLNQKSSQALNSERPLEFPRKFLDDLDERTETKSKPPQIFTVTSPRNLQISEFFLSPPLNPISQPQLFQSQVLVPKCPDL
ncbi:hypothetical protein VNO77_02025 [Canavalia gladiata]|uniref:Uncharacterized protein n=1 Tax=Canavalia gladiata TaxID=3824 RepID=A0AAN9MYM7_CANGL